MKSIISSLIVLIIIFCVVNFVVLKLIKNVSEVNLALKKGREGDLSSRIKIVRMNEIGVMSKYFNEFMSNMSIVIHNTKNLIRTVTSGIKDLERIMDNIAKGKQADSYNELDKKLEMGIIQLEECIEVVMENIKKQTLSTEGALLSLEKINSNNENIKKMSKDIIGFSEDAVKNSEQGFVHISEVSSGMNDIKESVLGTKMQIKNLKELSQEVMNIISSISDIAAKTDILAINAAIEASHSHETGKGSAVIAYEIRKLADITTRNTSRMNEILKNISDGVNKVEKANQEVEERVILGTGITEELNNTINEMVGITNKTNNKIQEISLRINEQKTSTEEIIKQVESISKNAFEIEEFEIQNYQFTKNITEVLIAKLEMMKKLIKMADNLKNDIEYFHTEEEDNKRIIK